MKQFIPFLLSILLFLSGLTQNVSAQGFRNKQLHRCYTEEMNTAYLKSHPNAQTPAQFESWLQSMIALRKKSNSTKGQTSVFGTITNYTLPIVFHVIHNGEAVGTTPNIAASYIQAQLLQLNKDYANQSGSPYAVASTTGIQFALATVDPTGKKLAEPGIDRVNRVQKGWGPPPFEFSTTVTDTIKPATIWDPNKYVNVWMLEDFSDQGTTGLLGIATLPSSNVLSGLDNAETSTDAGVVIGSGTVGSIYSSTDCGSSTNPYTLGRTLTHELGHYFGLRHIWGDSTCATDFCDDTPIHHDANYGKPKHPKPNSCGTADEMFEDYMDYTDDDIMNTFTANQVDRMQTVLLNSPRRMTLATSNVSTALPTGSNKLSFANCSGILSVSETGNAGTTQRYKDVNITLNVEKVATGTATVTLTTGGSAINGIDYQILSPTLSFAQNEGSKNFILRVLDNNTIDGDRTVVLGFTIVGNGVTTATTGQTLTVTIKDDDSKVVGQNQIKVINENFGTTGGSFPAGWTTDSTAGNPNQFVVGSTSNTISTGQWAYLTNNAKTKPLTYTKQSSYNYAVFSTPQLDGTSYKTIDSLSFKYKVGGVAYNANTGTGAYGTINYTFDPFDINSVIPFGNVSGLSGYGPYYKTSKNISLAAPSAIASGKFYLHFLWESSTNSSSNPGLCIDDVVLKATPFKVDTILSNSYTVIVPASTNNLLRSTTDNIIVGMNNSSTTLKSVVASLVQAGASTSGLTISGKTYQRSQKVFSLSNGTPDSTSTYNATLYFTTSETSAWSSNLKGLRVIQLMAGTTFASSNIGKTNATILTPISITDKRTSDGYVAVTIAAKGLGLFALVDSTVTLPIVWKSISGNIVKNAAVIKWETASTEKGITYSIEKSEDGVNFETLAPSTISTTSFTDPNILAGKTYYYRVIAIEPNGAKNYSGVISLSYLSLHHSFSIVPNPFKQSLLVQNFGTISDNNVLTIFDVIGREVYKKHYISTSESTTINTSNWLPGLYLVRINNEQQTITYKLVKQ